MQTEKASSKYNLLSDSWLFFGLVHFVFRRQTTRAFTIRMEVLVGLDGFHGAGFSCLTFHRRIMCFPAQS